jgi:glycosyltransferase involved in cell wall biosynthesis
MKVVVCSEVQWRYLRTRKQQILSRLPADWPILFLQAYVRGRRNDWRPQHDGRVTYVTVPAFKSVPSPLLRGLLDRGVVRALGNAVLAAWVWLVRLATGFGGGGVALYVSNIYFGRILGSMRRRVAVYDCNDNHLAFPGTPAWARGYLERVVRGADAVVVSSTLLREEIEPLCPRRIVEIGNGVDFELFDAAWHAPRPPGEITMLPAPRIGYAGALAEWIDLELLAATARSFPEATLVLVGPAVGPVIDPRAFFAGVPNVHWLGPKPHDELPHYVTAMDVCLIPFRSTPLTRGVNPNKLWEYLALGKPVVATDFSPFIHDFGTAVRIGATPPAFVAEVRAALAAAADRQAAARDATRRRDLARTRGWDRAASEMARLLETLAAAR